MGCGTTGPQPEAMVPFFIRDPRGTQSACPRPLSRKKLRQIMGHNHANLTAERLAERSGRATHWMRKAARDAERDQRAESVIPVATEKQAEAMGQGSLAEEFRALTQRFRRALAIRGH